MIYIIFQKILCSNGLCLFRYPRSIIISNPVDTLKTQSTEEKVLGFLVTEIIVPLASIV